VILHKTLSIQEKYLKCIGDKKFIKQKNYPIELKAAEISAAFYLMPFA